jgi:hypothetical protein
MFACPLVWPEGAPPVLQDQGLIPVAYLQALLVAQFPADGFLLSEQLHRVVQTFPILQYPGLIPIDRL